MGSTYRSGKTKRYSEALQSCTNLAWESQKCQGTNNIDQSPVEAHHQQWPNAASVLFPRAYLWHITFWSNAPCSPISLNAARTDSSQQDSHVLTSLFNYSHMLWSALLEKLLMLLLGSWAQSMCVCVCMYVPPATQRRRQVLNDGCSIKAKKRNIGFLIASSIKDPSEIQSRRPN